MSHLRLLSNFAWQLLVIVLILQKVAPGAEPSVLTIKKFVAEHCIDCHSADDSAGSLDLSSFDASAVSQATERWDTTLWEQMHKRLASRQMPPADAAKPEEFEYVAAVDALVELLADASRRFPSPGNVDALRRMTRTEYQNAIRDLLGLDVDVKQWLPADESSHGFDNITVGAISPTLLNRYITAAETTSRLAIGGRQLSPGGTTVRLPADQTQESHVEGLPLGTRGGGAWRQHFSQTGEYEIAVRLSRDRDENVEGLSRPAKIDVIIDRELVYSFHVRAPKNEAEHSGIDSHLNARIHVAAGTHELVVTFPNESSSLVEQLRQPFDAAYNRHRHPRRTPAIFEVSIAGPFEPIGPGNTHCRQMIFGNDYPQLGEEPVAAGKIIARLARQAYRREVDQSDLQAPLSFFDKLYAERGFEAGIEAALTSILVNPNFLLRVEREPSDIQPNTPYRISSTELASRLSFFLWSSLPDEELLAATAQYQSVGDETVLYKQVRRMLSDPRASSLTTNFASQWLHLRNLDSATPDLRLFPDFDDNLRQSFRRETELLFESVVQNDASVLELLTSDYSFLNERLAVHYGIPHVQGSEFRRVNLDPSTHRGGLLRHGSILTVTSYATRTSPTIRGNWIMHNILGTPPPPAPPNVPALKEKVDTAQLTVRERLVQHRENPACASCHELMDPIGFALENFDAVGRWRDLDDGLPIEVSGILPDGTPINGMKDLESSVMQRPEMFVNAMVEKLATFALGRGIEPGDGPEIRRIVRRAGKDDYRFASLVDGIVTSVPFQFRISSSTTPISNESSP